MIVGVENIPEFNQKIGRNTVCPCGSKKKFKHCHGHHSNPPETNIYAASSKVRAMNAKGECYSPSDMHHDCTRGTINAHTVSRSGSLGAIQRDGHVYSYDLRLEAIQKNGAALTPVSTGWKTASTFPGFCGFHDKDLFIPLEDQPFVGSREQCFLIAYRSVARELHAKAASAKQTKLRLAYAAKSAIARSNIATFNKGIELGLRDSQRHKNRYDNVLTKKDWSQVKGVLVEFDNVFPIQCASGVFPEADFFGREVQRLGWGNDTPDALTFSSFAADGKSYFLLCWLLDSDASCAPFAAAVSEIEHDALPAVLASYILQVTENCHFAPAWYDALTDDGKRWCREQSISGHFYGDLPPPIKNYAVPFFGGINVKNIVYI
jgi:hypothetical protein